jgi:hypothetical protein
MGRVYFKKYVKNSQLIGLWENQKIFIIIKKEVNDYAKRTWSKLSCARTFSKAIKF